MPARLASDPRLPPPDLETTSGAIFEDTVYSFGMLKPTTSPTTAAMPHQTRISFHSRSSLRTSSMMSISSYSSSSRYGCLLSSMWGCIYRVNRLTRVATIVASDAAEVPIDITCAAVIGARAGLGGTMISHPGSILAQMAEARFTRPFI